MIDDVSEAEKTLRFLKLEKTQKEVQSQRLQRYLNEVLKVLGEATSSRSDGILTGHSTCHKVVNFAAEPNMLGQVVDVRITEVKPNSLFGEAC